MVTSKDGSSPSTRGARYRRTLRLLRSRLIPVYAGSTGGVGVAAGGDWAHPRLRGEHVKKLTAVESVDGSSPSTRGALPSSPDGTVRKRLIPVYAGSTGYAGTGKTFTAAHPRLRGEHSAGGSGAGGTNGSSPSTRGALIDITTGYEISRLIPVYAGSTWSCARSMGLISAHPRLRGEHSRPTATRSGSHGSSPSTRGALADMVEHRENKEIYFTFSRLALDNHTRICFPKNFQAQFLRIAQPVPG